MALTPARDWSFLFYIGLGERFNRKKRTQNELANRADK